MSKTRWTKEQQSVIDSRGGNLLVAAAAGSGKTAVLVQRIINLITDPANPIDIDRLLVVTFTNAAAAEMKERVQLAIEKLIQSDGDNKQLKRQLILLEQASITTIHSFCLEVIKEYYYKIDLSPSFRIGSEQECSLLKIESMNEVFEELYKEKNKGFCMLIDKYASTRGDNNLKEMLLSMYHFVVASPSPNEWLENAAEEFNINNDFNFLKTTTGEALLENIKIELEGVVQSMETIVDQTQGIAELQSYYMRYVNEYYQFNKVLEQLNSTWDNIKHSLESIQYEDYRRGVKRVPATAEDSIKILQKSSKKIRDNCKDSLTSLRSEIFFRTEEDIKNEYKELYPIMKCLSTILKKFILKYQEKKKQLNLIDFNDIEHFALEILTKKTSENKLVPSDIAKIYSDKFEEIFIDEYQDSNLTQEVLLTSISRDKSNRFMVGDIKQSIYKFRQARPDIFLDKYNNYSLDNCSKDKKILLHKNFRSRGEVLDATNYIFEHIMGKEVGGLEYGIEERLNLGGYFKENTDDLAIVGGPAEVHLIHKDKQSSDDDDDIDKNNEKNEEDDLDKIQYEARVIGNIIKDLLKPNKEGKALKVIDKKTGEYRNVRFGDIVILLRSISGWQEIIGRELNQMGIPVAISSASGYLDSLEIRMTLDLLKVMNNLLDDISIAGTLRSPFFNFTLDEMMSIREGNIGVSYYEAICNTAAKDSELGEKCTLFINKINEFIKFSQRNSIHSTLEHIYSVTGYYYFIESLTDGVTRRTNLDLLIERAEQFATNSEKDIHSFINYIEELKEQELDLESAKPDIDNSNSINLMTIHKSKGLEFPIVICAGMGKQFNNMDLKNSLLYHTDLGYGPQIFDTDRKITYPSIKKEALKNKMLIENLAEEIRILYVALTRPKEKLILTGMVNDIESSMEKWGRYTSTEGKIPSYGILKSNTYLDWIMPSVLKHPQFKELCKYYSVEDVKISDHISKWSYKIWSTSNIPFEKMTLTSSKQESPELDIKYIINKIKNNTFIETTEGPTLIPESVAVTDLVNFKKDTSKVTKEDALILPRFSTKEDVLTGTQVGTIIHETMQKIDVKRTNTIGEINTQINELIDRGMILQEEAKVINKRKIYNFFKSELGKRLTKSSVLKREQQVSIYLDANEINNDIHHNKKVLVNGIVDTYFEEDNEIVIVDYKTDSIKEEEYQNIIDTYAIQLEMYKKALEKITNKKVKECYLYLFSTEECIKIS